MAASSQSLIADRLLYGSQDVPLAPVQGIDTRRDLPKILFAKRPGHFTARFAFALTIIAAG